MATPAGAFGKVPATNSKRKFQMLYIAIVAVLLAALVGATCLAIAFAEGGRWKV